MIEIMYEAKKNNLYRLIIMLGHAYVLKEAVTLAHTHFNTRKEKREKEDGRQTGRQAGKQASRQAGGTSVCLAYAL